MGISPHCAYLLRVPCVLEQGFSIQQCWCFDQNNTLRWEQITVQCGMFNVMAPTYQISRTLSFIPYLRRGSVSQGCHMLTRLETIPLVQSIFMMQMQPQWMEQPFDIGDIIRAIKVEEYGNGPVSKRLIP